MVHEFEHALLSGLLGNRWKAMVVKSDHGHFEYEYTKDTEHHNATIALAPYFFPLFTITSLSAVWLLKVQPHYVAALLVGLGYGIDITLNVRDISPAQTDFSNITGGFTVGLLYTILINITILSLLLSWVFQGMYGIKSLLLGEVEMAMVLLDLL